MPHWDPATLTEPQRKWFASVRQGLERDTGRTLEAWVEIARTCPETRHRARLTWMKEVHGLGQNRASTVLAEAFPEPTAPAPSGDDPLWADPARQVLFKALARMATGLGGVVVGRRKTYTAFSRRYQFAAARPLGGGAVRLGLAVEPELDGRLCPRERESWSERLTAQIDLADPGPLDAGFAQHLRRAWARS
ncbi:DUF4287 domain-containing protein [Caulobacter sp. S45]|uniref:DUF4287 domain-containing protein n=1 Tax=Caulobacter sp. S45 TaxID=1641861 RepID=UPI0015751490|nr:DUF4287 domain-containing protein [Caulobacter sp. S45]